MSARRMATECPGSCSEMYVAEGYVLRPVIARIAPGRLSLAVQLPYTGDGTRNWERTGGH